MNSLEHIKQKLLKDSHILIFVNKTDDFFERLLDFQETLRKNNTLIRETSHVEQIEEIMLNSRESFLEHYQYMKNCPSHYASQMMDEIYFSAHLNEFFSDYGITYKPKTWIVEQLILFENQTGFLKTVDSGYKFIKSLINKKETPKSFDLITDLDVTNLEVVTNYANEILKKYDLKNINLTEVKLENLYITLKKIDKALNEVSAGLGLTPESMGMNGEIGITALKNSIGFYCQTKKQITLGGASLEKSALLHEYIHAIDYHIGNKIVPNSFASEIVESVKIDDTKTFDAFLAIKKLTQEIFSRDPIEVEEKKEKMLKNSLKAKKPRFMLIIM